MTRFFEPLSSSKPSKVFLTTPTAVILRSGALARRLEGSPLALVAHPSRLAEDGEHLRMTAVLVCSSVRVRRGCASNLHARPRDDRGGTMVEQVEPDGAAEFAGAVCRACSRNFDERAAVLVEHRGGQSHFDAVDGRIA